MTLKSKLNDARECGTVTGFYRNRLRDGVDITPLLTAAEIEAIEQSEQPVPSSTWVHRTHDSLQQSATLPNPESGRSYADLEMEAARYVDGDQWLQDCYDDEVAICGVAVANAWVRGEV